MQKKLMHYLLTPNSIIFNAIIASFIPRWSINDSSINVNSFKQHLYKNFSSIVYKRYTKKTQYVYILGSRKLTIWAKHFKLKHTDFDIQHFMYFVKTITLATILVDFIYILKFICLYFAFQIKTWLFWHTSLNKCQM